ncbi:MAG: MSCRAMM family adhesin SdrC [Chloroflexota bacterium]|nr:MSCRAMM family adhesin SdrC [Chloroflexota bacterium]
MRRLTTPPARRVLRGQAGQTAVEYIGMLLVAATVIALVAASGVAAQVSGAIDTAVCIVSSGEQADCARRSGAVAERAPREPDADGDGLSDRRERQLGTLPGKADSDADGITDADELHRGSDPTEADSDGDGITDGEEIRLTGQTGDTFDPTKRDTDDDRLSDAEERAAGTPPDSADADRDGHGGRTDGLTDADEILRHGTDPTKIDTDGDGQSDGDEVNAGSNPLADERALGQKIKPLLEDLALGDLPTPAAIGALLKKIPGLAKHLRRLLGSTDDAAKALRRNLREAVTRRNRVLDARRNNAAGSNAPGAGKSGLSRPARDAVPIDDAIDGATQVSGRFPRPPTQGRPSCGATRQPALLRITRCSGQMVCRSSASI